MKSSTIIQKFFYQLLTNIIRNLIDSLTIYIVEQLWQYGSWKYELLRINMRFLTSSNYFGSFKSCKLSFFAICKNLENTTDCKYVSDNFQVNNWTIFFLSAFPFLYRVCEGRVHSLYQ